ncbi:MAG: leucyl/phenylalanyl-tRNA--protein transferase [Phycisphaerales bacterium]|jgi:leucyl/phenylalanyl-tRNA--protein transferase|nr:leucyl/phenylalanyl-tRNA--protein transferase [Phycisphaerales bacterium]
MLDSDLLLKIYAAGCFPMWDEANEETGIFRPDPRAIIELDRCHVPRRLGKRIRQRPFRITTDLEFEAVMDACHEGRDDGCWCSPEMEVGYLELHERGFAHSVEAWLDDDLVGGIYGVQLGSAFMAESKFSLPEFGGTDASKIVLVETVRSLNAAGFELFDVQFRNDHIDQFGVVEISADQYEQRLAAAMAHPRDWPVESDGEGLVLAG